jgi:phosphoglycerate kinase
MPIAYKTLADAGILRGKKVLLRLDLNVPIVGEEVRDDFRIQKSLPTVEYLRKEGAKIIIMSHLESDITDSLGRIASYLSRTIELKAFITDMGSAPVIIDAMKEGEVVLLENLRKDSGEKDNSMVFAQKLASLADLYVNDAFSVCHRSHASIVSIPKFLPSYAGPLLSKEIEELSKAFNPSRPFLFILGGAKFDTKLPLIEKFLTIADYVFVGGALANDIYKEKGFELGLSLLAKQTLNLKHVEVNPKLIVPSDVLAVSEELREIKTPEEISLQERIVDAGPRTISELSDLLNDVSFVLWNGPLGDYEHGFSEGTENLAKAIIESKKTSVIGGGDTIAVISQMGLLDKFSFVSTGGGAMLEFLAKGTLPGIEALRQ